MQINDIVQRSCPRIQWLTFFCYHLNASSVDRHNHQNQKQSVALFLKKSAIVQQFLVNRLKFYANYTKEPRHFPFFQEPLHDLPLHLKQLHEKQKHSRHFADDFWHILFVLGVTRPVPLEFDSVKIAFSFHLFQNDKLRQVLTRNDRKNGPEN